MDDFLSRALSQAVLFAIRLGVLLATGYAVKTVGRLLEKIPADEQAGVVRTRRRLETRVEIVLLAIDLVQLAAARGNTLLSLTLALTRDLKEEIDQFDATVEALVAKIDTKLTAGARKTAVAETVAYMELLLARIEEAIPLITLLLTTSGANLQLQVLPLMSPGCLLQASNHVVRSNEAWAGKAVAVGPVFTLTHYTVFYNPSRASYDAPEVLWKEQMPRCDVWVERVAAAAEFHYVLRIKERLDDGRFHEDDEKPREVEVEVEAVQRLFFSAAGLLLKLEGSSSPVLVVKVGGAKVQWLAFGESQVESDSEDEEEEEEETPSPPLLILEYILRLCSLQGNDQTSILATKDERLTMYLRDDVKRVPTTHALTAQMDRLAL